MSVVVVKCGGSNFSSITSLLERIGVNFELSDDAKTISNASHVILPGVGAAAHSMHEFREKNLISTIRSLKTPVIGICLGMQIMFDRSQEGDVECLKIIQGDVVKMSCTLPVPHVGWNNFSSYNNDVLFEGIDANTDFYYTHSFCVKNTKSNIAMCNYEIDFCAVAKKDNFYGAQFHPEKSGKAGETLIRNFLKL